MQCNFQITINEYDSAQMSEFFFPCCANVQNLCFSHKGYRTNSLEMMILAIKEETIYQITHKHANHTDVNINLTEKYSER